MQLEELISLFVSPYKERFSSRMFLLLQLDGIICAHENLGSQDLFTAEPENLTFTVEGSSHVPFHFLIECMKG